jgi:hypothetical protein
MRIPQWRVFGCLALFLTATVVPIPYTGFLVLAPKWKQMTGTGGLLGFLLFLSVAFALPLALLAVSNAASHRLTLSIAPRDISPVLFILLIGGFLSELPRVLADEAPRFWKMVAMSAGAGIKVGILIGALTAAKAVWSRRD